MRQRVGRLLKCIAFLGILAVCVRIVEIVLIPKFLSDEKWETTSRIEGFYQMEKDTVDVICLGSSRATAAINPQILYDEYGIRSYNLGFEQENMVTAYYWLQEALRYQKPEIVLLHTAFLFDTGRPVLNSQEPMLRKAIDWMRWSPNKVKAILTICKLAPKQWKASYFFTYLNYHSRWEELTENDYDLSFLRQPSVLKGYEPLRGNYGESGYEPIDPSESDEEKASDPIMEEYLDKIVDLCKEKGIELLLFDSPSVRYEVTRHNYVASYAQKKNVPFIDYGEKTLYESIGYQYAEDNADEMHPNIRGAEKISRHMGKLLSEDFQAESVFDAQWENTKESWQGIRKDCELPYITDIRAYLTAIKDSRYSVFLTIQSDDGTVPAPEVLEKLKALGMNCGFAEMSGKSSYLAVVSEDELVDEKLDMTTVSGTGSVRNNRVVYEMTSALSKGKTLSSIRIDGEEYSRGKNGWNLVVYSLERNRILDRIGYDPADGNFQISR